MHKLQSMLGLQLCDKSTLSGIIENQVDKNMEGEFETIAFGAGIGLLWGMTIILLTDV